MAVMSYTVSEPGGRRVVGRVEGSDWRRDLLYTRWKDCVPYSVRVYLPRRAALVDWQSELSFGDDGDRTMSGFSVTTQACADFSSFLQRTVQLCFMSLSNCSTASTSMHSGKGDIRFGLPRTEFRAHYRAEKLP